MRRHRSLDEEATEAILSGQTPESDPELAAFVNDVRSVFADAPSPRRSPELSAFMSAPLLDAPVPQTVPWRHRINRRKSKMLSGVATFVGTLTGKVVLGGAVAAASVGGLHAADVVDVPGLPTNDPPAVAEHDGDHGTDADEADDFGTRVSDDANDPDDPGVDGKQIADEADDRGTDTAKKNTEGTPGADHIPDDPTSSAGDDPSTSPEGTPGENYVPDAGGAQEDGTSNTPEGTPTSQPEDTTGGDPTGNADEGQSNRP